MILTGILKEFWQEQRISDKFTKREFILTDNSSQYPQQISFQLTQDRCSQLDRFQRGDEITVHFNINGRDWTSPTGEVKYFNTLVAWKLEGSGGAQAQADSHINSNAKDDLPF